MKPMKPIHFLPFLTVAALILPSSPAQAQLPAPPPETGILAHYLGQWEVEATISSGRNLEHEQVLVGETKVKWILGGRFLQQLTTVSFESDPDKLISLTVLMTWDEKAGHYRSWTFTSLGTVSESEGAWDADSQTMTWIGHEKGSSNRTSTTATFKRPGENHWSIATENEAGQLVSLITGENRKAKKEPKP